MGIASARAAGIVDLRTVSNTETYPHLDSLSIPEGQITPPEGTTGGMNGSFKHVMPRSPHQLDSTSTATSEPLGHGRLVLSRWDEFLKVITGRAEDLVVDGHSLDLATIVAVAR